MKTLALTLALTCLLTACAQEKTPAVSDADREAKQQQGEARMAERQHAEREAALAAKRAENAEWAKRNPKAARLYQQHPEWGRDVCQTISDRKIVVGFTAEQVRTA